MSDDRAALAAAVDELEAITNRLGADGGDAAELKALAEQALAASARVTELLPRIIREIERASEGDLQPAPERAKPPNSLDPQEGPE